MKSKNFYNFKSFYTYIEKSIEFFRLFRLIMNTARALFGSQLKIRKFDRAEISDKVKPLLEYYSKRDGGLISDRVEECILTRQKFI